MWRGQRACAIYCILAVFSSYIPLFMQIIYRQLGNRLQDHHSIAEIHILKNQSAENKHRVMKPVVDSLLVGNLSKKSVSTRSPYQKNTWTTSGLHSNIVFVHPSKNSTGPTKMRSLISCNKKWVVDVMSISPGVSVMKINIRVQSSQNYPCQLCSVEGKLSSHRLNIFSEFGSFTNATGFASITFRFDGDRMEMDFYVAVTGIDNMQNAVPAHDCLYTREKSIITHQELIEGICTTDFFKVGVLLTTFQPMKSQALEPTCTRNFGQGFWSILTKGYTEVKDIYQWKEDGCRIVNMSAKYFLSTLQKNTKIAFVGDSVLGNVYKDFLSFLHVPIEDKEAEYALDNGSALKYFLTYGYYTFNNTCCGEIDCRVRQRVRKGKLGFSKLKAALQWIRQSANCVLIVQSPAIHHARSHVTENVHAGLVKQILHIMNSVKKCRLVWFSTSPMGTHIIPKEKYVNNRSHRRWRLYNIEKQIISSQAGILWFDVWNLFWTRKDRFRDATHVDLVDKDRPPIIPSTCTAMLKHILIPENV